VDLVKNCVDGLEKLKIASQDDIQLTDHRVLEYGNVTFYREMETDRDYIVNWLMENGITLAGRFGEWDYLWSNQAMMSGFRAADSVINNID
jgi:protoporphyrinogen oxidase